MPARAWQNRGVRILERLLIDAQKHRKLKEVAGLLNAPPWQVTLKIVGSAAMSQLNQKHRAKNYVTDVLSFGAPRIFYRHGILGELVICFPVLKRQAKEVGHSVTVELEILLVHGLLHLLGLDHERNSRDAALMSRWERRLLSKRTKAGLIRRSV